MIVVELTENELKLISLALSSHKREMLSDEWEGIELEQNKQLNKKIDDIIEKWNGK